MLVAARTRKSPVRRVRYYFTLTPSCIEKLEVSAFSHRSRKDRMLGTSRIVEWLIETNAIAVGATAITANAEDIEKKVEGWRQGVTLHDERKISYGFSLKPKLHAQLLEKARVAKTSMSELIEWTVREDGLTVMNQRLGK